MKKRILWFFGLLLLGFCVPAFAATGELDFGQIMNQYQQTAQQFGTVVHTASLWVLFTLWTIDLCWLLLHKMLKGGDIVEMGIAVLIRVFWLGFLLWLMNTPSVLLAFINGFIKLGQQGANVTALSPSDVFWQGIDLIDKMTSQFSSQASMFAILPSLLMFGAVIIVLIAFSILAAQFAIAYIQTWFYLALYPIGLAFGVTRFTKDLAMKVMTTVLVYGLRFTTLYFVLAVGMSIAQIIGNDIASLSITNLAPMWALAGGSVILMLLALTAPKFASDFLSGTASLSAGDGMAAGLAAGGVLGAAGAGAMGMAKMAGGAINGVAGAVQAGSAAMAQAKERGATGMAGVAGGAAMALAGGIAEAAGDTIKGLGSGTAGSSLAGRINNKTASIRESNAAGTPAPSVPGGQPAAPSPASGSTPTAASGGSDAERATPPAPAPAAEATASSSPAPVAAPSAAPAATEAQRATPSAPSGGSIGGASSPATPPAPAAPSNSPSTTAKILDSAKSAIEQVQRAEGGAPGASIQTHHGEE